MSEQKFQYVPPEKNCLDNDKLHLFTPSSQQGKMARFQLMFTDNSPHFRVYTNDDSDKTKEKNYGAILAKMDLMAFEGVMELLKRAIHLKETGRFKVENKGFIWPYGKRSETVMLLSETHVGKDKDGVVWISVIAKDRPKLIFYFKGDEYHVFNNADGTPFSLSERSVIHASAWVDTVRSMIKDLAVSKYVDIQAKKNASKSQDKQSYDNQKQSKPQGTNNDFDDDIPF